MTPIYTALVKSLEVDFSYALTGAEQTNLQGQISADLLVRPSGSPGWSNTSHLMPETPFSGATANGSAVIDLTPIKTTIDQIEKETNYKAGKYDLMIVPHVTISGDANGRPVNETYSAPLTFTYDKTTITPPADQQASQPSTVVTRSTRTNHVNALVTTLSVSQGRAVGGLLALAAVATALAFGAVVFLGLGRGKAVQLLARHGVKLVPVDENEELAVQRVRVSSLDSLAKLAQRDGNMIFSQLRDDDELLFIPDGSVTYEYVYRPEATE